MKVFCTHTCALIKYRGISKAQDLLHEYMKDVEGTKYCLKVDVSKFYPSIDHEMLKKLLTKKFKDKQLLSLLFKIVDSSSNITGVPIIPSMVRYYQAVICKDKKPKAKIISIDKYKKKIFKKKGGCIAA